MRFGDATEDRGAVVIDRLGRRINLLEANKQDKRVASPPSIATVGSDVALPNNRNEREDQRQTLVGRFGQGEIIEGQPQLIGPQEILTNPRVQFEPGEKAPVVSEVPPTAAVGWVPPTGVDFSFAL